MKRNSTSTSYICRGMTLIEVVAGLALMGTLVAAMLTAKSRFNGQYQHAQRVLASVDALDKLLAEQWPALSMIEQPEHGVFESPKNMVWRAYVVDSQAAADWHCRVIRVEVRDRLNGSANETLASIDLWAIDPSYLAEDPEDDDVEAESIDTERPSPDKNPTEERLPLDPIPLENKPLALGGFHET